MGARTYTGGRMGLVPIGRLLLPALCLLLASMTSRSAKCAERELLRSDGAEELAAYEGAPTAEELSFVCQGRERRLAYREVVSWGRRVSSQNRALICLVDGSLLSTEVGLANVKSGEAKRPTGLRLLSDIWGDLRVSKNLVRAVYGRVSDDVERADDRKGERDDVGDHLELFSGDHLSGEWIDSAADDGESILFRSAAGKLPLRWDQIRSLNLNSRPLPSDTASLWIGLRDGSLLVAKSLKDDGGAAIVQLVCGATLRMSSSTFRDELVSLEVRGADWDFLSELEPLSYRAVPYLTRTWPLGRDRSTSGRWLRYRGAVVSKGLGMHSTSRVAYDLEERYERFDADLAIDDSADRGGSVVFRVYLDDGENGWRQAYESPIVRGGEPLVRLSVPVKGIARMALIVEDADRGDVLDRANWLHARLVRSR